MNNHQLYNEISQAYYDYLDNNNESMFLTAIYESLIQYQIDNNLE